GRMPWPPNRKPKAATHFGAHQSRRHPKANANRRSRCRREQTARPTWLVALPPGELAPPFLEHPLHDLRIVDDAGRLFAPELVLLVAHRSVDTHSGLPSLLAQRNGGIKPLTGPARQDVDVAVSSNASRQCPM